MACEAVKGQGQKPDRYDSSAMDLSSHLFRDPWASDVPQQPALPSSSLFNHGDPDLSFCDVLVADAIETESDLPSTVDMEEFTDLMLFPQLMGVFDDLPGFQDFPIDPVGGVDGTLDKPRETIPSVASVATDSNGEISPAASDASVEHFFNTFTDLTRFLDKLEEAGPSDLNDLATSIAGSNEPFGIDAEPSGTATLTTPPTPVGSETASKEENRARPTATTTTPGSEEEAPPTKRARTSRSKNSADSAEQKYRHRRNKNNVASQRSRASRKHREKGMATQVEELEAENERLRIRIDELSVIAGEARKCLVEALSQK